MFLILLSTVIIIILYTIYFSLTKNHDYWKKKNVPYLKPTLLFGNFADYILLKKNTATVTSEICDRFPDEPYVGVFYGTAPALVIKDPNIIKLVLAQDFSFFSGREVTDYANREAITTNLFFNGGDYWKVLRQHLTPLFTSAKLKNMFLMVNDCAEEMETFLEEEIIISKDINASSLFAKYTMECIIHCIFGIRANTMKRDEGINPFVVVGNQIFDTSTVTSMKIYTRAMWPSLFYGLGLKLFDEKIAAFFTGLYMKTCENRSKDGIVKNDFVNLLSCWKKENYLTGDGFSNNKSVIEVNQDLFVAQCAMLFGAGFETTSTTITFLLYELAKNKHAQDRITEEVDAYFSKNGVIKYECVTEMPYLEACIEETLRLYPVLGVLTREVMSNYTLPTGLQLQKGDRVHIPVAHIHKNPEYFPDPLSYRPERFFGDNRKNIQRFTYMAFGEGSRVCIGIRVARMVIYAVLLKLFRNYNVELAENMPKTMKFKPASFTTHAGINICLKFIPREVSTK